MKHTTTIFIAAVMCLMACAGYAEAENTSIYYRNAKTLGMGDPKVAGGFTYNGFIDNPALLSRVNYVRLSLARIPITLNRDFLDIADFINDNQENFEYFGIDDPADPNYMTPDEKRAFLNDLQEYDGKWARMNLSPMVDVAMNIMGNGFGLAVFNTTDVGFKVDRGVYEPKVWGEGYANTAVVLGYARPLTILYPGLTVGVNLKYFDRRKASTFIINASELGDISSTMDPVQDELENNEHSSIAADVGALLDIPVIDAEVGAVLKSLGDGRGASVDFGIAKRMMSDRLLLMADYVDFTDNNRENMFNKFHFGAEYHYLLFALRAGINSDYPTLGLGINTKIIDVDAAWFTDELGNAPGENEDERFIAQIKIGW